MLNNLLNNLLNRKKKISSFQSLKNLKMKKKNFKNYFEKTF